MFDGYRGSALFDTGSQVYLVSPDLIPYLSDFAHSSISIKFVNGAFLIATLQGHSFCQKVIAVVGVQHPVLLGMDLILSQVESMDFQKRALKFLGSHVN